MAYVLPTFNLFCDIYTPDGAGVPGIPTTPPRLAGVECNLAYGRRVNVAATGGTTTPGVPLMCMSLLLPALTDVRGPQDDVSFDMIEVPAASGRWYWVVGVDDIGKGFANEHRIALLFALAFGWVAPYP